MLPCRLLSSFQNNLEEITIIATPEESGEEEGGRGQGAKAVQLHSFLDPAKGALIRDGARLQSWPLLAVSQRWITMRWLHTTVRNL